MHKSRIGILIVVILLSCIIGIYILLVVYYRNISNITSPSAKLSVSLTPTLPASDSHLAKFNIDPYFSITYPPGWSEHASGCIVDSNTIVAFLGILKELSDGTAKIDICVYPITSQSGSTFTYKIVKARPQFNESQDQYETYTTNQVINGNKAYTTENITDMRNSDLPGLSGDSLDTYILHGKYVYEVLLSIGLNNRIDSIYSVKQDVMPEVNAIINSLSFRDQ